jgi:hypothetical protein
MCTTKIYILSSSQPSNLAGRLLNGASTAVKFFGTFFSSPGESLNTLDAGGAADIA